VRSIADGIVRAAASGTGGCTHGLRFSSVKTEHRTEQPKAEQVGFYFYPGPIGSHYWKTEFSPHRKNRTELSV
jgi:hypothetical protein